MSTNTAISLVPLGARTISGTSVAVDMGVHQLARLLLSITAKSGTLPTLVVKVQTSVDQSAWRDMVTSSTWSTTGAEDLVSADADRYLRVSWTIGGTLPSFTFSVSGVSTLVYAAQRDLNRSGASQDVLIHPDGSAFSSLEIADAIEEATDEANDLIGADCFTLPLKAWPRSHRMHTARAARYHLLTARGYNPDQQASPVRDPIRDGYADATKYWIRIAAGGGGEGFVDQTELTDEGGAYVVTNTRRGFGRRVFW